MSRNAQRWLRSREGMMTVLGAIILILALAVVGQLAGWWSLVPGAGTVLPPQPDAWSEPAGGYTCLPTCDVADGKMFSHVGEHTASFAADDIVVWIGVPAGMTNFELGIFDGDSGRTNSGVISWPQGNWDTTTAESIFTLYADPLKNGEGSFVVGQWRGNTDNMPNNDWFSVSLDQAEQAKAPSGHYFYRLVVSRAVPGPGVNGFKLRSTAYLSAGLSNMVNASFAIVGAYANMNDFAILHPEYTNDWRNPGPSNYNGEWLIPFYVPNELELLEVWDGDFDHGSWNGVSLDEDDLVTGTGFIPEWAEGQIGVRPQGAQGVGNPADDHRSVILRRSPAVIYRILGPDGESIFVNENPSGTEEWQTFRVKVGNEASIANFDAHVVTDRLPPGIYYWHIVGLDLHNTVWLRLEHEILGECADGSTCLPPAVWAEATCPRTIGYWKTNANKLLSPRPRGVQESVETYNLALANIAAPGASAFYRNNDGSPLTLEQAKDLLWLTGSVGMEARARQQLLATWLNVGSAKLGPTTFVTLNVSGGTFEGTVLEAIREAEALILSGANFERAKDIADQMNNGLLGEEAENSVCSDYEVVMPPDQQPPPRNEMPEPPAPPTPPNPTPDPEPDPETCTNLRTNNYNVENTTNNPFYGIKFEYQSGTEVRNGGIDEFRFTVTTAQAEQMSANGISVEAKAGQITGIAEMLTCDFSQLLPCGDAVSSNQFAFQFAGGEDNGDGTVTLIFWVHNGNSFGLSHATFGLPSGVSPSTPTNNYQSQVCQ